MANRITIIIFCSAAVFVAACLLGEPDQASTASLASVTPTPVPTGARANTSNGGGMERAAKQTSSRLLEESVDAWRKLFRSSGLYDLERTELASDDIEIRLWAVPDLFTPKTRCWIFSRKAGVWKGTAVGDREFKGRMIRTPLEGPPPGSTKWDAYVNQSLSPQDLDEAAKNTRSYGDGILNVVEVRFGKTYRREVVLNDEFLSPLFTMIKSEFFNNDASKWTQF